MKNRALVPWLLLPSLLGVVLSGTFVVRSVTHERSEAHAMARRALSGDVIDETTAWVASEITDLLALDAFAVDHPGLQDYRPAAEAARAVMARDALITSLELADARGVEQAAAIASLGTVPEPIGAVLAPLDDTVMAQIGSGTTATLDPAPYAAAASWVREQRLGADARAADARAQLFAAGDRPPFWQETPFLGLVLTLGVLAAASTTLALWRIGMVTNGVTSRLDYEQERVATLHERGARLQSLVTVGRRMSTEADTGALTRTLVGETRRFVGGDVVALARCDETMLVPQVVVGELVVEPVAIGDGVVGRCVDTGAPARTLVPTDPFFGGAGSALPLSILAAPLTAEGRVFGVLVAASRSGTLFDETSEMALHVLALLAAGALPAAHRLDSTRALTLRDPLTGLANRRRLDDDLGGIAVAHGTVGFLMVDIDHFKAVNDEHGHPRGDEVLRLVGGALAATLRGGDGVYRYGGEEFAVLLPGTDVHEARAMAERLRAAVRTATTDHPAGPVTVSIGVAAQRSPVDRSRLVEAADVALYAAKQAGRDRVSSTADATLDEVGHRVGVDPEDLGQHDLGVGTEARGTRRDPRGQP